MERFLHGEGIINFTQTWCKEKYSTDNQKGN